jgi:uncharacterized membrane protein
VSDILVIVLLVLHVGFIAVWFGAAVILSMILLPSLAKISPSARAEFIAQTIPRYARFIAVASTASVVFGVLLFVYETRVETAFAPSSVGTLFIEGGAALGFLSFILAIGVAYPSSMNMVRLLKNQPGGNPMIPMLQRRIRRTAMTVSILLALTLVLMVIGATI